MQNNIENLFNLISNLEIDEDKKADFLEKIGNEDFSEEFFDELEIYLEKDIQKKSEEIGEIGEKISEEEKKFSEEKEKTFEEKKKLLDSHRAGLKEIYDDANQGISEIEGEVDKKVEEISSKKEEDEANEIRKNLV